MLPIGQLMIEHRLIERMVALLVRARDELEPSREAKPPLLRAAADFMTSYGDHCHHGKEEDILFRRLADKDLTVAHREVLELLVGEHRLAREAVATLQAATELYADGDPAALSRIEGALQELTQLYPAHISREDREFFRPCMEYFSPTELGQMVEDFTEFDRHLVHETYQTEVAGLESRWPVAARA